MSADKKKPLFLIEHTIPMPPLGRRGAKPFNDMPLAIELINAVDSNLYKTDHSAAKLAYEAGRIETNGIDKSAIMRVYRLMRRLRKNKII